LTIRCAGRGFNPSSFLYKSAKMLRVEERSLAEMTKLGMSSPAEM
jgi:hypothetical protein